MNLSSDERKWLLAVLAVAFALRAGVVWLRFDDLQADPDAYLGIAHSLVEGRGYSTPDTNTPTAFRPPLYPLVLAAILAVGGSTPAIGLLHVLLGTATVYLTYCLGRSLGDFRLALLAAAVTAVDPLLVRYTAVVMTETLAALLVMLMFVVATLPTKFGSRCAFVFSGGRDSRRAGDGPQPLGSAGASPSQDRPRRWVSPDTLGPLMTGAAFGLCVLCRPTIWAFGALFGAWWLWRQFRQRTNPQLRGGGTPRPVATALWIVFTTAVVVLPWGVRNWVVFDRFILTTTHGGYTLLLGNNPVFYDEVVAQPWGTVWTEESLNQWNAGLNAEFAEQHPTNDVSEPVRDRWLYHRAVENIRRQPGMFARACWLRFRRFWNVVPLGEAAEAFPAVLRWGTGLFNALLFAAAAYGLLRLVCTGGLFGSGRPAAVWTPLVLLIVSFSWVHLVYWSNARMRAPVVPAVALLAASGFCGRNSRRNGNDTGTTTVADAPRGG